MAFRPHKFGRYIIVDPIAVGGMAEIYRARLAAAKDGPDRIIVIKKVIANLSQNSEFISMFEEEIKITVGLTHPNIIQIYDYGQVEEQYFMAMEYVEGKNLRQFVKRLADMKSMFSIDMSCYIISQVCHALGYAHAFKDRMTGKSLGIVHRDISPQNVMISYDGAVKLFDFGIAKAKSASEATQAGVIKGKPSYLSPEQINGEELDGRCDIFALGIVLWELLTAKRLFVADTDMGVLRLIQNAKIEPPSTFNPSVPQALDAIVLKSLARDRTKRYQTAEEFQRDLHKFLYSFNASFNPSDLSYYAQELFKNEIKEDRERLSKFLAMQPTEEDSVNEAPAAAPEKAKKKKPEEAKLADGLVSSVDFNRDMMELVMKESTGSIRNEPALEITGQTKAPKGINSPPTGKPPGAPGGAAATGNQIRVEGARPGPKKPGEAMVIPPWSKGGAAGSAGGSRSRAGTRTSAVLEKELTSQGASSFKNIAVLLLVLVGLGGYGAKEYGLLEGTPIGAMLGMEADPFKNVEKTQRTPSSQGNPEVTTPPATQPQPTQVQQPVASNQGVVLLQSKVDGYSVYVNGAQARVFNGQFPVPLNTPLNIQVNKQGFEPIYFQTTLTDAKPVAFNLEFRALPMGKLDFTTTPDARLTFYLEGKEVGKFPSPLRGHNMAAGRYRVRIENDLLGYQSEVEVVIEEGKLTRVEKALR